ncbi:MAG: DegT/DnrJ/EryC1/StrS family aminotransferase [Clostridia bacterium]|jgi:dTDP-4-amino-4,6-dideoxygalactose transaminase|nr:DegT/DnrJ/EryC1/StrS family aminotransferase [Clostridia bacterium]
MSYSAGPGAYLFGKEEIKEIEDVLATGYLFRYGSEDDEKFNGKVYQFEKEMENIIGIGHCVATSSGTGALMACMAALGIGPGDEVIVPGYTFIASISSIIHMNAIPVLAEVDESLTMDPNDIEKRITKRTKAIMPVHMLGNPCDMEPVLAIAKKHNLYVIEDCCQAAGAKYRGKRVGSYGDISAFSLNIFKTITAGDGGAVVTDDIELYKRAFAYHDQGHMPNRAGIEVGARSMFGMNMRISELTGAVALAQIRKIDKIMNVLAQKKALLKNKLENLQTDAFTFRKINDPGECATLLTILFKDAKTAKAFCEKAGTTTISNSGWHVYSNMEQLLEKKTYTETGCPFTCEHNNEMIYEAGMLPNTDALLDRAVNISIGVVDKGLGSSVGINILSSEEEIELQAKTIGEFLADCEEG